MASFDILWRSSARKELKALERRAITRILAAVAGLADDPHPPGCRKLQGSEQLWRIRVGDSRVISSVDEGRLCIEVIRIGSRQSVYKQ